LPDGLAAHHGQKPADRDADSIAAHNTLFQGDFCGLHLLPLGRVSMLHQLNTFGSRPFRRPMRSGEDSIGCSSTRAKADGHVQNGYRRDGVCNRESCIA
jgi:hypothetical protein